MPVSLCPSVFLAGWLAGCLQGRHFSFSEGISDGFFLVVYT